jgi:hypothetical protein
MRQKAVSIAPQNEAPIQIAASAAMIPIVAELSRILSRAFSSVSCSAFGNSSWRSSRIPVSTPSIRSTWPSTKSTSSANGKTASSRL